MGGETENAVIFGAGHLGTVAFEYYRKTSWNLQCYIDNNRELWGKKKEGLYICSPDILQERNNDVVIVAIENESNRQKIKEQVRKNYGIIKIIDFKDKGCEYGTEEDCPDEDELIIEFQGRLGNQIFSYALYKSLLKAGKNVSVDLSRYLSRQIVHGEFILEDFLKEDIELKPCNILNKKRFINENVIFKDTLENLRGGLFGTQRGLITGFYNTMDYIEPVKQELLDDICFPVDNDSLLKEIAQKFEQANMVSVHIRRGDYLEAENVKYYGNICTEEYYRKAIEYICQRVKEPVFCFMSDDIEWVKEQFPYKGNLFIESNMFEQYQDWYDLYLMTLCKHNIIANSTFSYWGAWLNQNPNKVVIAPSKFNNTESAIVDCPKEWVRL